MKKLIATMAVMAFTLSLQAQTVVDTVINRKATTPFYFSVPVDDGNYKVTLTLGSKKRAGQTVVRAESRRLFVENAQTRKGQFQTVSFIVSKRSPRYVYRQPSADNKSIELKEGVTCTKEEIDTFCLDLPRYKRPRRLIFDDVPRNPTGKIEKPVLRERYAASRLVERESMK